MKVLITGGAGYIGSTIASALMDRGHVPVILDSMINGREEFVSDRIFYQGDIADTQMLTKIHNEHPDINHVVHCAALIVVPDSVARPHEYYTENVAKTMVMLKKLAELGIKHVIFSSSASVYDDSPTFEVTETSPLNPRSPYARTKAMDEMIIEDFCTAYDMRAVAFRYFNVIGADPKMRSGPYIKEPSALIPKLIRVANGQDPMFYITGIDWPTRDGTGLRDYFHVWDLANAHAIAVEKCADLFDDGHFQIINLGAGNGVTVREFVDCFEKVIGHSINKQDTQPRSGDIAGAYTRIDKAMGMLGWKPELSVEQAIADNLAWDKHWGGR